MCQQHSLERASVPQSIAAYLPPFFLLSLSFFLSDGATALASPLLTAPTASLKLCLRAHLPTGAAALRASVPTSTVTLAAVVTVVLAALPAGVRAGMRGGG